MNKSEHVTEVNTFKPLNLQVRSVFTDVERDPGQSVRERQASKQPDSIWVKRELYKYVCVCVCVCVCAD